MSEHRKRTKNAEIEQRIRPTRPPLPSSLPPADDAQVDALLGRRGTISKFAREQVADQDLRRLRPHQWLNDEIINFYGALILARAEGSKENTTVKAAGHGKPLNAHWFSTFFWTKLQGDGYEKGRLAKWTKKVRASSIVVVGPKVLTHACLAQIDIFTKDVILIPVNHSNSHWTAAAINFRRKRFESYDSMGMARSGVFKVRAPFPHFRSS